MAIPAIIAVFGLGVIGAVGAKVGTDQVYPWLVKHFNTNVDKITQIYSEARMRRDIEKNIKNL